VRKLLKAIGLEEQRIQMVNLSSAMGGQFAFSAAEMTAGIKRLGPNPLGKNRPQADKASHSAEPPQVG
jgi:coenzyme F420-reducing hydrogenase delta subunit